MGKRLIREKSICSCKSPHLNPKRAKLSLPPLAQFTRYDKDIWTEIAKYLDGMSLLKLASTNHWFYHHMTEDSVWKYACLRDLQVPDPGRASFKWHKLYALAFNGSHSYLFHQQEKHIDWMRIGAFSLDSRVAFISETIKSPMQITQEHTVEEMLQSSGSCVLKDVKTGIWIADLQLVRCPVCDLEACDGTMQTLDARHVELFMNEGYQDGTWEYKLIGSHEVNKQADGASGGIYDVKHIKDIATSEIFNLKWIGKANDWQPKAMITPNAIAVNTNIQENEGLHVKYHVMRAGANGDIVSIRISQQLL